MVNFLAKLPTYIKTWFLNLIGESPKKDTQTDEKKDVVQKPPEVVKPPKVREEDRVIEDVKGVEAFFGKAFSFAGNKLGNAAAGTKSKLAESTLAKSSRRDGYGRVVKFLKTTIILLTFLLVLGIFAIQVMEYLRKEPIGEAITDPTPTPLDYTPLTPSAWAQDEELLKIEEDINVLDAEMRGTGLTEGGLGPPTLDFDVTF